MLNDEGGRKELFPKGCGGTLGALSNGSLTLSSVFSRRFQEPQEEVRDKNSLSDEVHPMLTAADTVRVLLKFLGTAGCMGEVTQSSVHIQHSGATPIWTHLIESLQEIERERRETVRTAGQQTFSVRGQMVNIVCFLSRTASVEAMQL